MLGTSAWTGLATSSGLCHKERGKSKVPTVPLIQGLVWPKVTFYWFAMFQWFLPRVLGYYGLQFPLCTPDPALRSLVSPLILCFLCNFLKILRQERCPTLSTMLPPSLSTGDVELLPCLFPDKRGW